MNHTAQLKRAQELEADVKAHQGEVKRGRDVEHHKAAITMAQAQLRDMLPKGCGTCLAAAKKINNALTRAGYFKKSRRQFALTTQERDYILADVVEKLF